MSSSEQDRVRELAERVARRLGDAPRVQGDASGGGGDDLAALRASLSEIQRRLAHIESHITHGEDCGQGERPARRDSSAGAPPGVGDAPPPQTQARSTWLSGTYVPATSHPSQEQFAGIGEAVSELVEF